uniref:TBC domain-containing protein kinase-like protein n=1 Tax=Meloidogyne incognita TaxID=6306 RepID=A0A914LUQ1_MELIC
MKLAATIIRLKIGDEIDVRAKSPSNDNNNELPDPSNIYTYMLGRFARITGLEHDNLCKYFEFSRCLTIPNGYALLSEHYSDPYFRDDGFLNNKLGNQNLQSVFSVAIQVCSALEFCHKNCFAIGSLSLDKLYVVPKKENEEIHVKLSQFGLCFISGIYYHKLLSSNEFPLYLAPELLLNLLPQGLDHSNYFCVDIWSFGILLIELFTGWRFSEVFSRRQISDVLATLLVKENEGSILPQLLNKIKNVCPAFAKRQISLNPVYQIILNCLNIQPSKRPNSTNLLQMLKKAAIDANISEAEGNDNKTNFVDLDEEIDQIKERIKNENQFERLGFNQKVLNELFFLWKLCGSSFETILLRKGLIKTQPPILTLPSLIIENFHMFGINETDRSILPVCIFELPMKNLIQRLNDLNYSKRFITLEFKKEQEEISNGGNTTIDSKSFREEEETCGIQSLLVKERDIEYQYQRMRLFRHLLAAWPSKSELLRAESCHDIPPVYRGAVWAAILGVLPFNKNGENFDDHLWQSFYSLDTFSEHISDRQLQVDIPRCHQYDELMSSPLAHHQLKILLKALLVSRKDEFVYWQGLDSLSAPFLILHFNDLSTAFRCLNAFIDRYLRGFFLKDNSIVIRSYLAEFMRVIEFCDSELFAHLVSLDFQPELFAIPWFLTCFAHVLPLHKLFHLWDALLLSDSEFPLFIGVAILLQLRSKLIKANFNEAILLFSDLPDLPIDQVVSTAKFYHSRWR